MKVFKWILASVFIFILIAVGFLFWYYTSNPKIILDAVSNKLQESYSLNIKADNVGFNLLSGIELYGVTLESSSGSIHFRKGSLLYNPFALFYKKLEIIDIKLNGLDTSVEMIRKLYEKFSKTSAGAGNLSIIIHRIEISDSTIIYNNIPCHVFISLSPDRPVNYIPVSLTIKSPAGSLKYWGNTSKGNLKITRADIGAIFNTVTSLKIENLETSLVRDKNNYFSCNCRDLKIYYNNLFFKSGNEFKLYFDLKALTIALNGISVNIADSYADISNLSYSIPDHKLVISARSSSIEIGDFINGVKGHLSGDFSLISQNGLALSANLTLSDFKYLFIKISGGILKLVNNTFNADMIALTPAGSASVHIESGDIFSRGLSVQTQSDEIDIEKILEGFTVVNTNRTIPEQGGSSIFKIFPVSLDLSVKNIVYKKLSFSLVHILGEAGPDLIIVKELKALLFRGNLISSFKISRDSITGEAVFNNGRLKEFSNLFLEGGKRLYGSISFKGVFDIPLKDISLFSFTFETSIINGEVKDFFLQEKIAQTLYDMPLNDIFFDMIKARGRLEALKLNLDETSFDSKDITASARGTVSFSNNTMDIDGNITILDSYLENLPDPEIVKKVLNAGHEEEGKVYFKVRTAGTFNKPDIRIE